MSSNFSIVTANEAVARIAYMTNEVFPIYPITPTSEMSVLVEQWSSEGRKNSFDAVPTSFQMQSEAGVAGTMHGLLQTGSLSSTFTASQGLLLMLPNMYKIAGELTPNVIHVATRSIATHALSIFGDHSDIMAVRQSGYALLGSASVQEAQDFALIAQASTLASKIPFVHFFDGFRTSHETSKIKTISDGIISSMLSDHHIKTHRERALNPNNPLLRGTSQGADVFFQSRESQNTFYNNCPEKVQQEMDKFGHLTGRYYKLFDYVGHEEAEHVIISMASSTETIETTIETLNKQGEKLGLIKVRLFRPFSANHLIEALPESVRSIAILDRTKEPGASGEPLYLDVVQSLMSVVNNHKFYSFPKIIGGRYGLSSKEFTPSMVNTIFQNLRKEQPIHNFTIGIHDDVTNLSLNIAESLEINNGSYQAIFIEEKSKKQSESFNTILKLIGSKQNTFVQGYTESNYKKSNALDKVHLRIATEPIKAPYLIENADFIACENANLELNNTLDTLKPNGILLVNTLLTTKGFWRSLSVNQQYQIAEKNIQLFTVNIAEIKQNKILKIENISILQACFMALKKDLYHSDEIADLKTFIYKVDTNFNYSSYDVSIENEVAFSKTLLGKLLANKGNTIPVSLLPADGTYPTNSSQYNPIQKGTEIPIWNTDSCTQCGYCSMACPQAALRIKAYDNSYTTDVPKSFKSMESEAFDLLNYTIQVNPDQCNSCNNCIDACPTKALTLANKSEILIQEKENWNYFEFIPEFDRTKIDPSKVNQQQLQEPLFKYSYGVKGCGEAIYLKLMTQLFGDRLLVANATGASSIFGGALPTTPWSKNKKGKGPAWSNSLFEDNAEFGLGFRLSLNQQEKQAKRLLEELLPELDFDLVYDILEANQTNEKEIEAQEKRIVRLKEELNQLVSNNAQQLLGIADSLVKKSIWIVGGDGWAYDIGFGGIDHVLSSGENVNILVLDNEVYDNTGGQSSKATPYGASAKLAFGGNKKQKKDLGRIAMTYDNVYVSSIAISANPEQTLQAFVEAESFNGPSIILAYTHSESHGIDMKKPRKYHKTLVNSGQWILYRNDPRKINSFQLDSNIPSIKIEDYFSLEKRFHKLLKNDSEGFKPILRLLQKQIDDRFDMFLAKATNSIK